MIWVLNGEYKTQPVRTGISEAPRWLPAKLISTPTWPASMRVMRTAKANTKITTSRMAAPITKLRIPGIAGRIVNSWFPPRPLLNTSMISSSFHTRRAPSVSRKAKELIRGGRELPLRASEGAGDKLFGGAGRRSGLDVPVFDPQEQNHQTPEVVAEIGAALHVIADERFDAIAAKQIGAVDGRGAEGIHQQRAQRAAKPIVGGNVQAGLGAAQHGVRQFALHQALQHDLVLPTVDFHVLRQARGKLDEAMIEKRRAHLERMRHAHAIDFLQDVVGEVVALIEGQIAVQRAVIVGGG